MVGEIILRYMNFQHRITGNFARIGFIASISQPLGTEFPPWVGIPFGRVGVEIKAHM